MPSHILTLATARSTIFWSLMWANHRGVIGTRVTGRSLICRAWEANSDALRAVGGGTRPGASDGMKEVAGSQNLGTRGGLGTTLRTA